MGRPRESGRREKLLKSDNAHATPFERRADEMVDFKAEERRNAAARPAWEARLAAEWRDHFAGLFRPCDRCRYLGNEHAIWCTYY